MVPVFFVFFMVPDTSPRGGFLSGAPTALASEDIGITLDTFMQAQDRYGVSWAVLAAIAWTESRFGLDMGPSSKGAVGYMQFMPTTWSGMNNPAASNKPPSWDTNPETIEQYGGYGVDANGDGVADPFDPEDAVFAAARYLADKGLLMIPPGVVPIQPVLELRGWGVASRRDVFESLSAGRGDMASPGGVYEDNVSVRSQTPIRQIGVSPRRRHSLP